MRQLKSGEKMTTLAVSLPVAKTIRDRRGGLSVDNYLRQLLSLKPVERPLGRPAKKQIKKRKA